jgi:pimeloyl-ACP methyl ester carboxylesterase
MIRRLVAGIEAALLTDNLRTLVLYEPPLDSRGYACPPGFLGRLEAALRTGNRQQVIETMMTEVVGLSLGNLSALCASPSWAALLATTHTLPREVRAAEQYRFDPARFRRAALPAVVLAGENSPEALRTVGVGLAHHTLRSSRVVTMPGVGHEAVETGPEVLTAAVLSAPDAAAG